MLIGYSSSPWLSVTGLYGARSETVPRGASIVAQRWLWSSHGSPPHQLGSPRLVDRQYANCSAEGAIPLQNGSSAPFHIPTPEPPVGSPVSVVTTCCRSESVDEPGVAWLNVLRLTQV